MSESAQQGRRVLLPFSLAIGPPLILLSVLAFVAAKNDEQALRYVEEERTRQAAQRAQAELHAAVRGAEEAVFRTLLAPDALEPGGRPDYQSALRAHPIARRFLTVSLASGRRIWPRAELPFREGHEEPPRVDPSDEGASLSADVLRKRSELLDYYQRSKAQQEAANLYNAAAGFRTVAESEAADPTIKARAAFRLGTCLERLGQASAARQAFQIAAEAPLPVRDELGLPVRVLAAIRVAELWRAANEQGPAADSARALARALLAGARSGDVTQSEWLDGLTRMRAILTALGESEAEAEVAREQAQVLERVRWTQALDDLIPSLLQQARQRGGSEVRHHALLGVPPRVLAYRVEQSPSGGVVIGFDLDLDRLAREVLGPACATVNLEEEISLAVVDGRGSVRAYAGKDARPGDDGLLPRAAEAASVDLVDVPLWAVQVRRSTAQLASARRNRLILYGALLGLTLAAAVTGAIATLRYVRRSLELARMKSDFVSNMTHELKTPLTSIKMYGELLAMGRLKKEQKRKEYAEHIVREADRLQKLIEDVLDFARSDSGQHDYVLAEEDVADTVAEAIDLFRLSAKVRGFDLFVELPPVGELPAVDLDRDAIVRSVLNLLSNAVKYSTDERWIRVSVRRTEDDHIMISVKDRGIGIDPEDLERIFDRFYRAGDELTRAISGAGLGLSLIDQIVRAHGGEIQVESEKGVGSTFRILLPIVEEYRDNWPPEDLDVSDLQSGIELESADDLEEAAAAYEAGQGIDAESQLGKVEQESETESPTTETEAESPTVETESESPTAETESESPTTETESPTTETEGPTTEGPTTEPEADDLVFEATLRGSWINRIVGAFLRGPYSILLILLSLVAGGAALAITPREEDPQIVVPAANLLIQMPGASAAEVERQVSTRLEKLLAQIEGVEYVYSTSMPGQAVVTARFYVGEDREDSLVRLHDKVQANQGVIPPGVSGWVVSPLEIDDVPIVNVTLTSARYDDHALRRMAEELEIRLQAVENAGRTFVVGGRPRELTLTLSPQRMSSRGVDLARLRAALVGANVVLPAGALVQANDEARLQVGRFLSRPEEVGSLVVATHEGRPVFLREVADVRLGPAEATRHVRIAFGPAAGGSYDPAGPLPEGLAAAGESYPAVVVAVAKKRGSNAVWVSHDVQAAAQRFAREVLPPEVHLRITRDYGHSADEKVSELLEALWVAIAIVVALLAYALGWREGLIIALAVPITFSLTLLVNLLLGYTINRVTLFALILALGLVVDDPIVDVENVHRHLGEKRPQGLRARLLAVLLAVNEVRPPIILATLAVIVSFVPLFFITGMMGPYMAPMALNVPVAMLMSLLVAFTITPWLCLKLLVVEPEGHTAAEGEGGMQRAYRRLLGPLLDSPNRRLGLLGAVVALLALCVWLVVSGRVPLKMLPYDNKNELQVVLDLPEGTPLERTEAAAADLARVLTRVPEVTDVSWFCGTASPMDFNGLIRQYFLRAEPHQADLRVNLVHKKRREQQSHGLGLRLRAALEEVVRPYGGRIAIVEVPPGPPVVSTVVAEVRGPEGSDYAELVSAAARVRAAFAAEEGIVDVDDVSIAPQRERIFELDRTKAALHGVSEEAVSEALAAAFGGRALTTLRLPREVTPLEVVARLPRASRQRPEDLLALDVAGAEGMVPLRELGRLRETRVDQPIFHKQLEPVAYVFGETAGATPAEAVLSLQERVAGDPALRGYEIEWAGEGEWKITLEVFRDLGIAFAVAVLGIYVLLIYQTGSYLLPLVLLVAIPLTVIGIVPGFWLLNLVAAEQIGGVLDPVYFTATGMIGMIALAGIATRNAILLIEFVQEEEARGTTLRESLIRAGAVRTRAILLTAGTALLAAWPITLDPIFSGLAWALIFGLTVSTAFTLLVVPAVYFMVRGAPQEAAQETA